MDEKAFFGTGTAINKLMLFTMKYNIIWSAM